MTGGASPASIRAICRAKLETTYVGALPRARVIERPRDDDVEAVFGRGPEREVVLRRASRGRTDWPARAARLRRSARRWPDRSAPTSTTSTRHGRLSVRTASSRWCVPSALVSQMRARRSATTRRRAARRPGDRSRVGCAACDAPRATATRSRRSTGSPVDGGATGPAIARPGRYQRDHRRAIAPADRADGRRRIRSRR